MKVKEVVDDAIDKCGELFNLRDSIESFRIAAEEANDERQKKINAQKGENVINFRRTLITYGYMQPRTSQSQTLL